MCFVIHGLKTFQHYMEAVRLISKTNRCLTKSNMSEMSRHFYIWGLRPALRNSRDGIHIELLRGISRS